MRPRTIRYYFREAFRSVVRNRLMSVASIFTVASCIFLVSVFYILAAHFESFVRQMEDTVNIVVFIDDDLPAGGILQLESMINNIPQVASLTYVTREEALDDLHDWVDDPAVLYGLELDNPLRNSFVVELTDLAFEEDVYLALLNLVPHGIANIRRAAALGPILVTLSNVVQVISLLLILLLGVISVVIIMNTIRITVNARRHEINIMKYVGATDWFIRWPFVIEGAIIGFIGGIIPSGIVWLGYGRVAAAVGAIPELTFVEILPADEVFVFLFPFAMAMGTIIGLVGSTTAVKRHLKV